MNNATDNRAKPETNPISPRTLKDVVPGQPQFWLLRFTRRNGAPELIESRFQLAGNDRNGNRLRETLAVGGSLGHSGQMLDALCIVAVKARCEIARGHGTNTRIQVENTTSAESYAALVVNGLHKAQDVGQALFGSSWNTMKPVQTGRPRGRKICKFTWGGPAAAKQLQIHIGGDDTGEPMRELTNPDELLNLAADLEAKHPNKWPQPLIQRPPAPGVFIADKQRLARWRQAATDWDQQLLAAVEEAAQPGPEQNAAAKAPLPWNKVLPAVARWALSDDCKGWTPGPDSAPAGIVGLQAIEPRSDLRLPALYKLAEELRRVALMKGHVKLRRKPPELTRTLRPADETAVLLVPLLEPENPQAGQPVKHKAFRGWLRVERVPVPKWQSGEPLWDGGNFYPAPAFALLEQDPAFRAALDNAEQYVRRQAGPNWRTDCDYRWSLARTDGGGVLPPVLLGNHLGAAFALALAQVAGVPLADGLADGLDLRGATVIGDMDAQGNLRKPNADLAELQRPLAEAVHAGELVHLLTAPGVEWPTGPLRPAPIAKAPASTLDDVAAALRPAGVVRAQERTETERIEFLTRKMPRKTHYTDVPLLAEVSQARAPKDADGAALTGIALDTEDRRHNANFGFHSQPVDWRGLFTDFARHCPEAAKQAPQPHFVVIGPPGSGKSSLGDHVIWCMAAGEAPFHDEPRLGIRVSLREWEESKHADLAAYLANGHPGRAAKRAAWPDQSQWDTWLTQGRLALVLDGLDELAVGGTDLLAGRLLHTLLPEWRGRFPLVLTCRTVDVDRYRPQLPDWPIFGPAKFTEAQTRAFIDRYPPVGRKPDGQPNLVTSELMAQLAAHPELLPLAEVPMLLNVICFVVDGGLQLPATKGQLYDQAVDRLLERKLEIKIHPFTQADAPDARRLLAAVAAALFRQNQGPQLLRSDRVNEVLREQLGLAPYTPDDRRAALFRWFIDRSGLLRKSSAGYTFLHNQFYEFLAGEALAADADFGPALAPAITKPDGWREVLKFAAAARLARPPKGGNGQADVCGLLDALAQPRADGRPEFLLLATAVAREVGLKDWDGMDHDHMGTLNRLRQRLEAVRDDRSGLDDAAQIEDEEAAVQKLAALQQARARAASARGWLGGLPKGVGVVPEDSLDALPDIDWLTIPAGPFTMGGEEWWQGGRKYRHRLNYTYRISRFPITHAQWDSFERFKRANGYLNRDYWTADGWQWLQNGNVPMTGWPEDYRKWYEAWRQRTRFPLRGRERWGGEFDNPAHPVLVAWYEAAAYARWLTEQLRRKGAIKATERILLPNEPEWERAARGTDGRLYPWGNAAAERELTRRCNWDKTELRQTSAVSLFSPEGDAPSGAADMAGNVWEWTRSLWGNWGDDVMTARPEHTYPYDAEDGRENENAGPEIARVLRGASWISGDPGNLVASYRGDDPPGYRFRNVGFRLVCVGGFAGG